MTEFTAGPWERGESGTQRFMVYALDATGQRIADCTNELTFHSDKKKIANAQLISAAPELLDALSDIISWIDNWGGDMTEDEEWPESYRRAADAMIKARGET
jgi:hypothetical protein